MNTTDSRTYDLILKKFKSLANPKNVEGMARFGISAKNTYGISAPNLRKIARETGKNHALAKRLWQSEIHEARLLASLIDNPREVTEKQMDQWVKDFESWDVCDACCGNLFDKTPFAYGKCIEWAARKEEFVKRAGFALMAYLAVHDKRASDREFLRFLPVIRKAASDDRNFVKKAVNWALRQIGKRNATLNKHAVRAAEQIAKMNLKAARWIAADALRELKSESVQKKLKREEREKKSD